MTISVMFANKASSIRSNRATIVSLFESDALPLSLLASPLLTYEPVHEKTNNLGFRPDPTQIRLYSHRIKLEA